MHSMQQLALNAVIKQTVPANIENILTKHTRQVDDVKIVESPDIAAL